jgi:hypothetical protein
MIKPIIWRYLFWFALNVGACWLAPPGRVDTALTWLAVACLVMAAFHYKPRKEIDAYMDVECWLEAVYHRLAQGLDDE